MIVRRVNKIGRISIERRMVFLSQSLAGWDVGLKSIGPDRWELWFNHLRLGAVDTAIEAVTWANQEAG